MRVVCNLKDSGLLYMGFGPSKIFCYRKLQQADILVSFGNRNHVVLSHSNTEYEPEERLQEGRGFFPYRLASVHLSMSATAGNLDLKYT